LRISRTYLVASILSFGYVLAEILRSVLPASTDNVQTPRRCAVPDDPALQAMGAVAYAIVIELGAVGQREPQDVSLAVAGEMVDARQGSHRG
jgi:hypothetical protein